MKLLAIGLFILLCAPDVRAGEPVTKPYSAHGVSFEHSDLLKVSSVARRNKGHTIMVESKSDADEDPIGLLQIMTYSDKLTVEKAFENAQGVSLILKKPTSKPSKLSIAGTERTGVRIEGTLLDELHVFEIYTLELNGVLLSLVISYWPKDFDITMQTHASVLKTLKAEKP